jgi:hypothetical protein
MDTYEILAEGSTLYNAGEPYGSVLGSSGLARPSHDTSDTSAAFPVHTDTGRMGRRIIPDVMLDDDYGYQHKDTKNKRLTVQMRSVFSPGFGKDGNLTNKAYRIGLSESSMFDHNVSPGLSISEGYFEPPSVSDAKGMVALPVDNPVFGATHKEFIQGGDYDQDVDPESETAGRNEPLVVTPILATENAHAVGLEHKHKGEKSNARKLQKTAKKKFMSVVKNA